MPPKKRLPLNFVLSAACFIAIVLSSCQISFSSRQAFPSALLLSQEDVPSDWVKQGEYILDDVPGAIARDVRYTPEVSIPWKGISHRIAVYPSEKEAIQAFSLWQIQWLPGSWQLDPATTYLPQAENDPYYLKSADFIINGTPVRSYTLLQLHSNLIMLVVVNIDDQYLTLGEFEGVLYKLDEKLQAYPPEENQ